MPLTFKEGDFQKMIDVEKRVGEVVRPLKDRVEAALVAFALLRMARALLNLYPEAGRRMLVEDTAIPFLRNEPVDGDSKIITLH